VISRTGGYVNSKAPTVTPTKAPTSAPTKLNAPLKLVEPIRKDKLEKKFQKLELGEAIGMTLVQKDRIKRKIVPPGKRNANRPSRERGAKRSGVLGRPVKADKLVKTDSKDPVKKGLGVGLARHANPSIKVENRSFRGIQPQIVSAESFKLITQPKEPEIPEPETPATVGIPVSDAPVALVTVETPEPDIPEVETPEPEIPEVETPSKEKLKHDKVTR